jgi:hypothetical protein
MLQWDDMVSALKRADLSTRSVHATQDKISGPALLSWGSKTCALAEQLGVTAVTGHHWVFV